jgi:hypothetical protein
MKLPPSKVWSEKSVWGLVAANAYVLFGVVFLGWDAAAILVLYWAENVVIGLYTILKVAIAHCPNWEGHLSKLGLIPLFIIHYGMFCLVHGFIVMVLTRLGDPGQFSPAALLLSLVRRGLFWPLWALVVSHGMSFVENYVLGKEYRAVGPQQLMLVPYGRAILLHVTIVAGGMAAIPLGSPAALLAILIALKTVMDLWLHWRSHAKLRRAIHLGVSYETATGFNVFLCDEDEP